MIMPVKLKTEELLGLMKNFYTISGFRFVLFDENFTEILSYPPDAPIFCAEMRKKPEFYKKCWESDCRAFETCRSTRALNIYRCHAGMMEATAPITADGTVIGYIMFGQIADRDGKEDFSEALTSYCQNYLPAGRLKELLPEIQYRDGAEIVAAAKILEACTSYILSKEMIRPSRKKLFLSIDAYVSAHLAGELDVETLCAVFNMSRTRLYEALKPYVRGGIASWIREKRLERAKRLLLETNRTIADISDDVGFTDYNYFLRVFRKTYGISPMALRKERAQE